MHPMEGDGAVDLFGLMAMLVIQHHLFKDSKSWKLKHLTMIGRRRRDRRYPRMALRTYEDSPFAFLLASRNDQALLNATGVDHAEFTSLLSKFQPLFDCYTVDERTGAIVQKPTANKGRKRSIDAAGALGLVLMWYRTKGSVTRTLPLIFGLTLTPMVKWLRFAKVCLFEALADFAPKMPSVEQTRRYMDAIGQRYPHVASVAFAADGLKLPIQPPANDVKQNKFYNGWKHGHFVTNVIVFAADGSIPCCALNAPGCLHDSTVADYGGLYDKLQEIYNVCGAMTVIDSAFSLTATDCFLKSSQTDPVGNAEAYMVNRQATSVRQLAEWGMHQLQAKFPRMADKIKYEENGERRLDISLMIRLYNHQVRRVGMNQILDTYMMDSSPERTYFNHGVIDNDADNYVLMAANNGN